MFDIIESVPSKILLGLIVAFVWGVIYYSLDIFLRLTRRNFTHVNVYLVFMNRHDHVDGNRHRPAGDDSLIATPVLYELRIKSLYVNRWDFWQLAQASFRVKKGKHILRLDKELSEHLIAPIRGRLGAKNANAVGKRMGGLSYVESTLCLFFANGLSDVGRRGILRVFCFREQDLQNGKKIMLQAPARGKYLEVYKEAIEIYHADREAFPKARWVSS